jgi:beta-glucanase (GH16 family)
VKLRAVLVACVVLGAAACTPVPFTGPSRPAPPGPASTFADEFAGPAGARPGPAWRNELGAKPGEQQYYTNGDNAYLDGHGHLVLEARTTGASRYPCSYGPCTVTSAKLTMHRWDGSRRDTFDQAYGHFEARMQLPTGAGLWPAFWMEGADVETHPWPANGELDVMEACGQNPRAVSGHAHAPGLDRGGSVALAAGTTIAGWHVYALDWTPDHVTWSVDGRPFQTLTKASTGSHWVFHHPFFLELDLAVGGTCGAPTGTRFPARVLVDDVRVTASTRA